MSLANSSNGTHPSGRYRADRTGHERTRNTEDIQANMRKKRLARGHASEQEHDTSQAHPGKKSYEPDSVRIYMQQKAEQRQKAAKLEAQLAEQKRQQVTSSLRQLDSFRKRQGKIIRQRADKHNATHSSNAHSLRGSLKSSVDRPNLTKDLPSVHQARNARVSHINMSGPEKNAPQFTQHSGPTLPGAHINANASSAHHKLQSLVHGAMALQERIKRCLPDAHCDETSADTSDSDSESMTSIAPTLPAKSIDRLPFQQSGASGILLDTGLQNLRVGHREALPKPRHNGLSHNHTNIREDEESESVAVPGHSLASDYPEFGFSVPTSSMSASDGIMRSTFKSKLHSSITSNNAINPSGPISILRRYELLRKQKHNGVQVTSEMKLHNRAPNSANSSWATPRDKAEGEDDYYNIINVIRRKCPQKNLVVSKQQEELPKKWSSPYNRRSQTSSEFKGRENIDPQLRTAGSLIVGSICIDTDEDESSLQHVGSEYSEVSAQRKGIESITSRLRENLDENSMGTRHTPLKNMPSLEPPKENPKAFNIAKHSLSKSPNSQSLPGAGPHISNSGSLPQRKENFGKDSTMPTSGTASSSGKSPRKRRVKHTQDHGTFAESRHALDQHQRLSPTSLSRKLTAEMNLLEAVEESRWQLAELERHEGMGVTGLQVKELGAALLEKERHYDMDLDMARKAREIRAAQSSASNVQNRPALPLQEPPVSVLDLDSEVQDAYSNNTFEEISSFPIPGDGEMFDTSIAIPPSVSQTHGQESSMVHAERDDISEMGTNDERVIGRQPAGDDISMIASEYDQQNFTPSAAHSDNIIPNNLTRTTTQTDADSLKSDTHFAASVRSLPPMHQSQNAHRPDHPKERGMERLVVKLREARDAVQLEKLERKEHKLKLSRKIAEILIAKKQESKEWRSRLAIEEAQIATMLDDVLLDPETHANSNQAVAPSKKSNSFHSTVLAEKAQKLDKQTGSRSDRPFSVSTDSASKRLPNTIRRDLSDNSTPSISNNSVVESPSNGFEEEDIDEPLTDIVASAAEPDDDFLSEIPTAEDISEISELVDTKSRKTVVASSNSYDDEALEDIASVDHHDRKTPPQNEHSLRISQIVDEGSAHILRRIETLRQQLSERKTRADLLSRAKLEKQQNVKEKLKVTEKSLKRELMSIDAIITRTERDIENISFNGLLDEPTDFSIHKTDKLAPGVSQDPVDDPATSADDISSFISHDSIASPQRPALATVRRTPETPALGLEKTVSQKDEALAETEVIDEDLQSFEADSIGVVADYSQESFERDNSVESESRGTDSSSPQDVDASIPVKPDLSDPPAASGEKSVDIQLGHTGTLTQESAYSDATGRGMDEITISGPSKSGAGVAAVLAAGMVAGVIAGGDERNGSDSNSPSQELYIREKTVSQKDEALAETEVIDEDLQSFEADSIGVGADYSQESFEKDDSVVESERRGTDSSSPPDADASIPVKPDLSDPAEASGEKSLDIQLEHTGTPNQESAYSDATGRGMEEMTISGPSKSGAGVVAGLAAGMVTGVVAGVIAGGNDSPHTPEITPPSEQVEDSEYPDEVDEEIESFSEHTPISEIVFPATELTAEQPKPTLATQSTSDGMTQKSLDVHGPTVADVADALNVENQVPQSSTIPEQHETSQAVYPGLTEPSVPKMVDQPMPVQQVSESAIESLTQGFIDALLTDSVEAISNISQRLTPPKQDEPTPVAYMDQRVVPNSCLDTAKVVEERYNPAKDVVLAAAQADHSKANDVAEALMQNLLDDAVTAMTPKSLPVVQSPPTSIKPDNSPIIPNITDSEMSNSEQVVAFARDLLTNHLPADKTINGKFLKAPVIPNVALESMKIDKRGAYILNRYPLIFDATNEALQEVFEPHYRYYESQLRHLHRKRMLPPRGLTHEQVIESAIKHVRQWADYKEDHGENLDSLLIGEVHAAEKRWKDRSEFDEQVKEAVFQDLWEHLLDDTVATVQRI